MSVVEEMLQNLSPEEILVIQLTNNTCRSKEILIQFLKNKGFKAVPMFCSQFPHSKKHVFKFGKICNICNIYKKICFYSSNKKIVCTKCFEENQLKGFEKIDRSHNCIVVGKCVKGYNFKKEPFNANGEESYNFKTSETFKAKSPDKKIHSRNDIEKYLESCNLIPVNRIDSFVFVT